MKTAIKTTKWLMLLSGILITLTGITIFFTPLTNLAKMAVLICIGMVLSGISEIVSYCEEEKERRSGLMLVSGILSAMFGAWTLFGRRTSALSAALPFVFAVWVMISGITRIVGSITLRAEGFTIWSWVLGFGILGTAFGFLLLFLPVLSGMMISFFTASMLIAHGINNIIIFSHMQKLGGDIRNSLNEQGN